MTNDEAKFVLAAYRPNGADARETALAEALQQAGSDPALRAWFERSQAFDRIVAQGLREVIPPADLRASLLAGVRVTRTSRAWWRSPVVWGLAAMIAVVLVVGLRSRGGTESVRPDGAAIRELALADMGGAHPMSVDNYLPTAIGNWLADPANRLGAGLPVEVASLQADRCREIEIAGRPVFEICFKRDAWYHVYIAPRDGFDAGLPGAGARFDEVGEVAMATWTDARHVYVLATDAGLAAVQNLL